jgi:hypothetical protein
LRHRGGAAGAFCAAMRAQTHDSALHVAFAACPPVALQHRYTRQCFQVTTLKFRNNPQVAAILPNGTRFFA